MSLHKDALEIIEYSINEVLPDAAVRKALLSIKTESIKGRIVLVAIGKAAWQMANVAYGELQERISKGIVITKYGHVKGAIGEFVCMEAGHPVPDENSFRATRLAMDLVSSLSPDDAVLFLVSGGGSALFEYPLIDSDELEAVTSQMLACGMDIVSMNIIRKRLSAVKGGKFAALCSPARVHTVVLSDIVGDPLDMIASGPSFPDSSTSKEALAVIEKYNLKLSDAAMELIRKDNTYPAAENDFYVTGSVSELCEAAVRKSKELGYTPVFLTGSLCCEAKDAGIYLASVAKTYTGGQKRVALIAGGETVVHVSGNGKGGRNQEMALTFAREISGLDNVVMFSVGSDGTDGPTDAAGGIVDGGTAGIINGKGRDINSYLADNDAYNALMLADCLVITGPTGTNVNDLSVVLIG